MKISFLLRFLGLTLTYAPVPTSAKDSETSLEDFETSLAHEEKLDCAKHDPSSGSSLRPFPRDAAIKLINSFCAIPAFVVPEDQFQQYKDEFHPVFEFNGPYPGQVNEVGDGVTVLVGFMEECEAGDANPFFHSHEGCREKLVKILDDCNTDTVEEKFGGILTDKVKYSPNHPQCDMTANSNRANPDAYSGKYWVNLQSYRSAYRREGELQQSISEA